MADFAQLSDDELLALSAKRPEAFGELYERHVRAVRGFVRHEGLRTDEALDVTAEVFAAALVAKPTSAIRMTAFRWESSHRRHTGSRR